MTRPEPALSAPLRQPRERRALIRGSALLAAILIGLYVCYLLAVPFLPALTWALTIATLVSPLHGRLERRLKSPGLSAATSVAVLALLVFLPLTLLGQQFLAALSTGITSLQEQLTSTDWQGLIQAYPALAWLGAATDAKDFAAAFGNLGTWLTNLVTSIVRGSVSNAITVLLTFYLLFYFLRDRREILAHVKLLSPFTEIEIDYLFGKVFETIHGIFFGTIITAAVQGILGGLIFWLLGLPNPLFWGVIMALLAIVPVLGAFVIWVPVAVYLALSGAWWKAVVLAAYGSMVIGVIDNILHPVVSGTRLHLHTIPALLSIIGGLMLFGASGLILGPLAVTLTIGMVRILRARADGTGVMGETPSQGA